MKVSLASALVGIVHYAVGLPQQQRQQIAFAAPSSFAEVTQWLGDGSLDLVEAITAPALKVYEKAQTRWRSHTEFEVVALDHLPDHTLRVKEPKGGLCDSTVRQHSGYLDISDSRHLFFWFFESRGDPATDPLVLWLNGGPGCSSTTGLLMELGPCNVAKDGNGTDFNPFAWNEVANMIFLDQPISVGFSYTDGSESVNTSQDSAVDVYAFLQLFYSKFPKYAKLPFHVAAESYGGHYAPHIGAYIHEQNKKIRPQKTPKSHHIPLESLMIGNGLTEPYTQFASTPDFACKPAETAIWDEQTCRSVRSKVPTCQRLQKFCYDNPTRFTCLPAALYCWQNIEGPIQNVPVNPYNVKVPCDRETDGPLCYPQIQWIETFLNKPEVKKTLGAPDAIAFEGCNMKVNQAFLLQGDSQHNSASLLQPLLEDGIRVLVYAGDYDFMCNWIGNKRWFLDLETPFKDEVNGMKDKKWRTLENDEVAGEVRTGGNSSYTFIRVFHSGHMVPLDKPEFALDMVSRWLARTPLV